jgi:hypothetical protein
MHPTRLFLVVAVSWATVVAVGLLPGCKRPCESSGNCVRTCECLNNQTNQRIDCSLAFRCEGDTQVCEDAHDDMSCEDLCADYAGTGRCGVERCASDLECQKAISCPIFDGNGQPTGQFFDCTLNFRCQPDFEACQPRSTVANEALCANECLTGVIADE